ncbi:MAG: hypothetical protein ACT4OP_10445, partial [Actinomycetota bacterium]
RVEKGSDLNRAARSFVGSLPKGPWLICHADLPFIDGTVLAPVVAAVANGQSVIAPSRDGGTSLLGANMTGFPFAYGVASFHRHLAALAGRDPIVVIGPRLAVDLDDPSDLVLARRRLPWVEMLLDTLSLP